MDALCNALLLNIHKIGRCGWPTVLQTNACRLIVSRGAKRSMQFFMLSYYQDHFTIVQLLASTSLPQQCLPYSTKPPCTLRKALPRRCTPFHSISPHAVCARRALESRRENARAVLASFAGLPYVESVLYCYQYIFPSPFLSGYAGRLMQCAFRGASYGHSSHVQSLLCTLNMTSTDILPYSLRGRL